MGGVKDGFGLKKALKKGKLAGVPIVDLINDPKAWKTLRKEGYADAREYLGKVHGVDLPDGFDLDQLGQLLKLSKNFVDPKLGGFDLLKLALPTAALQYVTEIKKLLKSVKLLG